MPNFTELRYGVGSAFLYLATEVVRKPPVLKDIPGATLELAVNADRVAGDFYRAAEIYLSVYKTSENHSLQAESLIGLSQQFINLGYFGEARRYLDQMSKIIPLLPHEESRYYSSRQHEKLGWIAGYQALFSESIDCFVSALVIAKETKGEMGVNEITKDWNSLERTCVHFLGRGYFGLATRGNKDKNLKLAISYFDESLKLGELRNDGSQDFYDAGFDHLWKSLCYYQQGNLDTAEVELFTARRLFTENKYNGVRATEEDNGHTLLVSGLIALRRGQVEASINEFQRSLYIFTSEKRYPRGAARALRGLALAHWSRGEFGASAVYFLKALKTSPLPFIDPNL